MDADADMQSVLSLADSITSYDTMNNVREDEIVEDCDDEIPTVVPNPAFPATRHPEYYFMDGNCVIRVEATLFKVCSAIV
jgi:hypothetical protein